MIIKHYGRTFATYVYLAAICTVIFAATIVLVFRREPNLDLIKVMVDWSWRALIVLLVGGGFIAGRSAIEDFAPTSPQPPSAPASGAPGP
jgi:hypothetical protein